MSTEHKKKGFVVDLETETIANKDFRRVLYTAKNLQLVVMSLPPKEEIGEEVHHLDQFIRIDEGEAQFVLNGNPVNAKDGYAVVVPAGTRHNVINTSATSALKLYTVYGPPDHLDGTVHHTKADVPEDEPEFDGKTTE